MTALAIDGGTPVRATMLPYGRQSIDAEDIAVVVEALQSDWLTTGPRVVDFEKAFAALVGAEHAVAVSNGTAALHAAMFALGVGPGDEVIVPSMTFAASANCVVYQGGTPVFADVQRDTLLLDLQSAESKVTFRTKAIIAVDYAGHPCDYDALRALAARHGLKLVADACHALGGRYKEHTVGALAELSAFSLHPVKHVTTGEGGVVTTGDRELSQRMRLFRNHGITSDHRQREKRKSWFYEMIELGYNYRLTDIQCALGLSQLLKFDKWISRRREIARRYDEAFAGLLAFTPLAVRADVSHAYHLYVVKLNLQNLSADRETFFRALRAEGIGVNVHYIPVHLHPFYRRTYGTSPGLCPVAEEAYRAIISLPIFPAMLDADVQDVITACLKVADAYSL